VLATSRVLTPTQKKELAALIGPSLQNEDDIIGAEDLNGLIRKYPDIEKSHIKLWLSGVGVLERVVRSAAHTINKITREEIEAKVRVYAPNPSFNGARDTLEAHHLVIISGPPGVGKTEMLSYAYIAESWGLCRSEALMTVLPLSKIRRSRFSSSMTFSAEWRSTGTPSPIRTRIWRALSSVFANRRTPDSF
jgi:hypothetical protein